ncbi:unnamed protein product [Paramecium octaurelia]|uniref:Uncharacterized protein n=1 Tax=Paramecium octaurelia TaxID=43137 RepID=A0A8S1RZD5_PAROT|nr:unnamed protein product [Paramecium octaurelia]
MNLNYQSLTNPDPNVEETQKQQKICKTTQEDEKQLRKVIEIGLKNKQHKSTLSDR